MRACKAWQSRTTDSSIQIQKAATSPSGNAEESLREALAPWQSRINDSLYTYLRRKKLITGSPRSHRFAHGS
ncbi:MAG: hypothetical protein K9G11_03945 [Rickettsiaceae bacterium]|nr:hypothetical protein [Rickettsiaceae bacterium]